MPVSRSEDFSLDSTILGQIMIAENILPILPADEKIGDFTVGVFGKIPGLSNCRVCIRGTVSPSNRQLDPSCRNCRIDFRNPNVESRSECALHQGTNSLSIALRTPSYFLGVLYIEVSNSSQFNPYLPFIKNFCNQIALHLENRLQSDILQRKNEELKKQYSRLEELVRLRTKDLSESEEKFSTAFQNAPVLMTITSLKDGRFYEVNNAFVQITGYSRELAVGATSAEIGYVSEDERNRVIESMKHHGQVKNLEITVNRADGSPLSCMYSGEIIEYGGEKRLLSIAVDISDRKMAEKALLVSERKWRNVLVNVPQLGITLDTQARIVFVNDYFLNLTGWKKNEVLGQNWFDMFIPEPVREEVRTVFHAVMRQKDTLGFSVYENVIIDRTGNVLNIAWSNVLTKNKSGNVIDVTCLGVDITERKRAEETLKKREKDLRESQEIAHLGSWRLDIKTNEVVWTEELYKMYGFDPALPPPPYTEHMKLFTPESWQRLSTSLAGTIETGIPYELELETVRRDGANGWMWVRGEAEKDEAGEIVGLWGAAQDITIRKQAEIDRERLLSAIEQSHETIVITDTDGNIQYTNPSFEETSGYSCSEVQGQNPRVLKSGVQDQTFYKQLWETISAGNTWTGRIVNKRKDGALYTEDVAITPVKDRQGIIVNYVGVKRDVTKDLELEKRISQAQRMEAIGTLAGGIAHDFNNLLFPIIGISEMLLEDLPEESLEYENAKEIYSAARRGSDLVQQILSFSRQSNQQKLPVRVQDILKEALRLCRSTIPSNIEIHSDIQKECGVVMADPSQIHQVIMNLVTNAYHAVDAAGGSISIRYKEAESVSDDIAGEPVCSGKQAVLTISDTGCGIDSLDMDKIFEPYFTTKPQGKGTGLGLATVYGIVKEHGGDITVSSEPGKGSTFTILLPLMLKSRMDAMSNEDQQDQTGTEHLLVVDDEEPIIRLEAMVLKRAGYEVTTRTSSIEALAAFRANPERFDLVLTDMTMPNLTGDQLAVEMLSIKPDIPIIICTGFSEALNEEKATSIGVRGILMKPVVKSELRKMIRNVLDEDGENNQE